MRQSIAICSGKGGVGKTTLALNLGLALSQLGYPTTILETDPLGSLRASLNKPEVMERGLADILLENAKLEEVLVETRAEGLSILPAGKLDTGRFHAFEEAIRSSSRMTTLISSLHEEGRAIVLIDSPAGFASAVQGSLKVADSVIIPLHAEPLALRLLESILQGIETVRAAFNPKLRLLGIVMMMLQRKSRSSLEVLTSAWGALDPEAVFETVIPRREEYLEASLRGVPVAFLGSRLRPEERRFQLLAREILDRIPTGSREENEDTDTFHTLL